MQRGWGVGEECVGTHAGVQPVTRNREFSKRTLTIGILVLAATSGLSLHDAAHARADDQRAEPEKQTDERGEAKGSPSSEQPRNQTGGAAKPKSKRATMASTPMVRRAVIDLEAMAKERREGQILPGDPSPGGVAGATVDLPDTGAPNTGALVEPAPVPVPIRRSLEPTLKPAPRPTPAQPEAATSTAKVIVPDAPVAAPAGDAGEDPLPELAAPEMSATNQADTPQPVRVSEPVEVSEPKVAVEPEVSAATPAPVTAPATAHAATIPAMDPAPTTVPARTHVVVATDIQPSRIDTATDASGKTISVEPPAVSVLGPVKARVIRTSGAGVEWRSGDTDWSSIPPDAQATGRVEVRAGLDGDTLLVVEDHVEIRIGRLARAVIETAGEADGTKSVHVTLSRGLVEVRLVGGASGGQGGGQGGGDGGWSRWVARVRTPDRGVVVMAPSSVEYDAFSGTRLKTLE